MLKQLFETKLHKTSGSSEGKILKQILKFKQKLDDNL
jgi:hypothetical protein